MNENQLRQIADYYLDAMQAERGEVVHANYDGRHCSELMACFKEQAQARGVKVKMHDEEDDQGVYCAGFSAYKPGFLGMTEDTNHRFLLAAIPSQGLAEIFNMSAGDFDQKFLESFLVDYGPMNEAMKPLVEAMSGPRDVLVTGRGTNLTLQLEDIPAVGIAGKYNLPDGEVFSAPVKESLNGDMLYGPAGWGEGAFEFMRMKYKDGKAVEAEAQDEASTAELNRILDGDKGARYTGEFAIAFNPHFLDPVGMVLFDEKIAGSMHIAHGHCLKNFARNANTNSRIHWDMVHIQRPEYGGGDIKFDGKLIRRDGLFVPESLQPLNPENLKRAIELPLGL